jgi:hypothetical protein
MAIAELYQEKIKSLSAADRLQLATLILNDISPECMADYSSEWTDEDLRDVTAYSLRRAGASMGEDED